VSSCRRKGNAEMAPQGKIEEEMDTLAFREAGEMPPNGRDEGRGKTSG